MTPDEKIAALGQSINLVKFGRYKDVEGEELTDFILETIDWVNQFTPELELEANWNYLRTNNDLIGTVSDTSIVEYPLPDGIRTVAFSPYRPLTISFDGSVVSHFAMVDANQIANPSDPYTDDRATLINGTIILSRPLTANELNGEIRCDTIASMPKLSLTNTELLDIVKPLQLIILGVAKNAILPNVVQGGITPSLTQKYGDLLKLAIADNNRTATTYDAVSEDFSYIRGVY